MWRLTVLCSLISPVFFKCMHCQLFISSLLANFIYLIYILCSDFHESTEHLKTMKSRTYPWQEAIPPLTHTSVSSCASVVLLASFFWYLCGCHNADAPSCCQHPNQGRIRLGLKVFSFPEMSFSLRTSQARNGGKWTPYFKGNRNKHCLPKDSRILWWLTLVNHTSSVGYGKLQF